MCCRAPRSNFPYIFKLPPLNFHLFKLRRASRAKKAPARSTATRPQPGRAHFAFEHPGLVIEKSPRPLRLHRRWRFDSTILNRLSVNSVIQHSAFVIISAQPEFLLFISYYFSVVHPKTDVCCLGSLKHEHNTLGIRLYLSNSSIITEHGQKTGERPNRIKTRQPEGGFTI